MCSRTGTTRRASFAPSPAGHARFPFRMMVDVPVVGKVGDSFTSYFRDFGTLRGHDQRHHEGRGVLLELEMTQPMRAKLADKLTWLEKRNRIPPVSVDGQENARASFRQAPRIPL